MGICTKYLFISSRVTEMGHCYSELSTVEIIIFHVSMTSITPHLEDIVDTLFVIKHRGFLFEFNIYVLFLTIVCALALP